MAEDETLLGDASELRLRAEEMARADAALWPENINHLSPEEAQRTLHELRVHQIELEMQNEELRRTQVELADSKASYVDLYDFAPVGYCAVSEQGLILKANLTAAGLLAVARSALVRTQFGRFVVPEDEDVYYLHRKQLFASGAPQVCELRLLRKDSSPFWALLEATAAQDADGMPVCHVVMSDITERKQKEEALARSQAELKTIYDHAPVMMCLVGADRRMLYANPAFIAFTGASEGDLKAGRVPGLLGCINALDDPRGCGYGNNCGTCVLRLALEDAFRTGQGQRNIEQQVTLLRDGAQRIVTVLVSIAVVPTTGQRHVLLCLNEITERKLAEEEREKLRTQLVQAQKMETIGRLAGGVAHEFNNQLTVINGYSQLALRQMQPKDSQFHNLTEILHAGERSADLVRQLLAFSRKQVLEAEVLSLNTIVSNIEQMLHRLVGDDIQVVVRLDPAIAPVEADRHQIEQVIMNLAVNARDAMPDGGTLTLETGQRHLDGVCNSCREQVHPGAYVELTLRDTGIGMDAQILEHLFEPFFTTKGVGKGTGLGLSTVQGIAIQSGGHIVVESEPGKGSSFHIYLPVAERPALDPGPLPVAEAEGGTEAILLVEDQQQVCQFVAGVLRCYGYHVVEAVDAADALRRCAEQSVDMLITDVAMPKMSGVELAKRIRLTLPGLKMLFISGYSQDTHEGNWEFPSGGQFLQKPFSPDALAAKVREVLDTPTNPLN